MRVLPPIVAITLSATLLASVTASAQNVGSIVEGRKAWLRLNCYGCHGDNGTGARAAAIYVLGRRTTTVQIAMEGGLRESGMPSYVGVPLVQSTDFANLAAYMRSVGTPSEPKWHDWWRR